MTACTTAEQARVRICAVADLLEGSQTRIQSWLTATTDTMTINGITFRTAMGYATQISSAVNALPLIGTDRQGYALRVHNDTATWQPTPDWSNAGFLYDGTHGTAFPNRTGQYLRFIDHPSDGAVIPANTRRSVIANRFLPDFRGLGFNDEHSPHLGDALTADARMMHVGYSVFTELHNYGTDATPNNALRLGYESPVAHFNRIVTGTGLSETEVTSSTRVNYVATLSADETHIEFRAPTGGGINRVPTPTNVRLAGQVVQVNPAGDGYELNPMPSYENVGFDEEGETDDFPMEADVDNDGEMETLSGMILGFSTYTRDTIPMMGETRNRITAFHRTDIFNSVVVTASQLSLTALTMGMGGTNIAEAGSLYEVTTGRNQLQATTLIAKMNREIFDPAEANQLHIDNAGQLLTVVNTAGSPRIGLTAPSTGGQTPVSPTRFFGIRQVGNSIEVVNGTPDTPFDVDSFDDWLLAPNGTHIDAIDGRIFLFLPV